MSEPIPESIPTSTSRRSHRPLKKRALDTPLSQQSSQLDALFANPDRPINLPPSSTTLTKSAPAPPEIVANVQGSSAGAGSGEFHVYKASRRREYERLRVMDEEVEKEKADREFEEKREEMRRREEEVLERNRKKREKAKTRKGRGKGEGMELDGRDGDGKGEEGRKRLGPAKVASKVASKVNGQGAGQVSDNTAGDGEPVAAMAEEGGGITIHDDD